jgi:hypothetical protein
MGILSKDIKTLVEFLVQLTKISSKKGHNMENCKTISSIHFEEVDFDMSNVTGWSFILVE